MAQLPRPRPIPMSYWVEPGPMLAGHYPGCRRSDVARAKLRALLHGGVTYFVDLTTPSDGLEPYHALLEEQAAALGLCAKRHAIPILDFSVPSVDQVREILDVIDAALARGELVYVHCWGGLGRTGTIVGAWLVRHGMSGDDALAKIACWLADTPRADRQSPETPEQRALVRNWRER